MSAQPSDACLERRADASRIPPVAVALPSHSWNKLQGRVNVPDFDATLEQTPSPSPKIREVYYNGSDLGETGGRPRSADHPPIVAKKLCTSLVVAAVCSRRQASYARTET